MNLDDIPISNRDRDKAWEQFIKTKSARLTVAVNGEFGFPLDRGYYELWCIAWNKAWDKGFKAGWESKGEK